MNADTQNIGLGAGLGAAGDRKTVNPASGDELRAQKTFFTGKPLPAEAFRRQLEKDLKYIWQGFTTAYLCSPNLK